MSVKLVASYYFCPVMAWLSLYGPSLAWGSPHYDPRGLLWEGVDSRRVEGEVLEAFMERHGDDIRDCSVVREPLLRDSLLMVRGRPDLLIECGDRIIIVEVKTRRLPDKRDPGYIQAILYAVMARNIYGGRVMVYLASPSGERMIPEQEWAVAIDVVRQARRVLGDPTRLPEPVKSGRVCRTCRFNRVCPYSTYNK